MPFRPAAVAAALAPDLLPEAQAADEVVNVHQVRDGITDAIWTLAHLHVGMNVSSPSLHRTSSVSHC